jgi:glycosyltransferase involved in cell wall biosynthesis
MVPNAARPGPEKGAVRGLSVVIPAYNEELGIATVLADLRAALESCETPWEILVVNDGSDDGTAQVAASEGVQVIQHRVNLGYGASLKTGIRRAQYDCIAITDADATYPAERVLEMVKMMDDVDMVVGARTGDDVQETSPVRRFARWCLRKLAEYLVGEVIPDLNSGLRCFRKSVVEGYMQLLPSGFSFTTTLTLAYHADSRLVYYMPINYRKREGTSKISPLRDTYQFLLLILRTVMYFDPMRIFIPPALVSLVLTIATFGYEVFWVRNLAEKSLTLLMITIFFFSAALLGDLIVKRAR